MIQKKLRLLANEEGSLMTLFEHSGLSVKVSKLEKGDLQEPHDQNEVYLLFSGKSELLNGGEGMDFYPSNFLLALTCVEHRFENFNDDFSALAIFYGSKGGEKP